MAKDATRELLSPELERDLRRLAFSDPAVEEQFRQAYAERARLHLRVVLTVLLAIPLGGFIAGMAGGESKNGVAGAGLLVLHVAALVLTWSPLFPRVFQGVLALLCLVAPMTVILDLLPDPTAMHPLLVAAIYTYTLFRLRFRLAVAVYWTLMASYLALVIGRFHAPLPDVARSLPGLLVANLMGMAAAYTLEHWSRRDFILTGLLQRERQKSEALLLNVLPPPVADRLKESPGTLAETFPEATVLFADIVDFTPLAGALTAEATVALFNEVFSCFDGLADRHGLEKIKTIGDVYMVAGGLPAARPDHAEAVVAMAVEMQSEIGRFRRDTGEPLRLRIGIHTGPVVAGVIGTRKFIYDLWGDTVNLASRLEAYGTAGGIQVSSATYEILRERHAFRPRQLENVKGMGELTAYVLVGPYLGSSGYEESEEAPLEPHSVGS